MAALHMEHLLAFEVHHGKLLWTMTPLRQICSPTEYGEVLVRVVALHLSSYTVSAMRSGHRR